MTRARRKPLPTFDEIAASLLSDDKKLLIADARTKSTKQIAEERGWPVGTVKSRLHRAVAKVLAQ